MNITLINATTLPDAWFQTVYKLVEEGKIYTIDQGSYEGQKRLEFDYIIVSISQPWFEPLLPSMPEGTPFPPPVSSEYLNDYLPYLMTGDLKENESYTYGERLSKFQINHLENKFKKHEDLYYLSDMVFNSNRKDLICFEDKQHNSFFNQIEFLIDYYKKGKRSNQMCLQVAAPADMLMKDPPCLRLIDTKIQDNKLHFFPYFRSWDLFNGFPANLAGIELLKQYCASEIGVDNGQIVCSSKGLHIYDHLWEIAESLRGMTIRNK